MSWLIPFLFMYVFKILSISFFSAGLLIHISFHDPQDEKMKHSCWNADEWFNWGRKREIAKN